MYFLVLGDIYLYKEQSIMIVSIERIKNLFDEETVEEMLSYVGEERGVCHYNAAEMARSFDDWNITYVEGYLGDLGHAINCYTDSQGNKHYFDITQEKFEEDILFLHEFEVVQEFEFDEVNQVFGSEGCTRLIAVSERK